LFFTALPSCGYSIAPGAGAARAINVSPIAEQGIDIDAASLVAVAVRHAVARGPSTRLASDQDANETLQVELLNSASSLAVLADPALRAAQNRAMVTVRGRLLDKKGHVIWESAIITCDSPFLSTPGPIETLDGARRRALQRAAEDAADRLVASMTWR
jgi:hypothetical protein